MSISKEKLERLLELMEFITPGPWQEFPTVNGAEIHTVWEKKCNCEKHNADCLFDCVCDEVTLTKDTVCEVPERGVPGFPQLSQAILDAEFICIVRNIFPELVKAYVDLLGEESN
jgi:hypothetical protein